MISLKNTLEAIKNSLSTLKTEVGLKAEKDWVMLGSTTGITTAITIDLGKYSEVLLVAESSYQSRLLSALLPTSAIPDSPVYVYGSGGKGAGTDAGFAQFSIGTSSFKGTGCFINGTNYSANSEYSIYAR